MATFPPPAMFNPLNSPADEWEKWKNKFRIYYGAAEIQEKSEDIQRDILLYVMGDIGQEVVANLDFQEPATGKVDAILSAITQYYKPYKNLIYKRHEFSTMKQSQTATLDQYVLELTKKAKECDFGTLTEEMIRDRLIGGVHDHKLKQRLLRQGDLSLARAIEIGRVDEMLQHQWNITPSESELNAITKDKKWDNSKTNYKIRNDAGKNCKWCAMKHPPRQCPAYGKKCNQCGKMNHFARVCKNSKLPQKSKKQVGTIQTLLSDESVLGDMNELSISEISANNIGKDWVEELVVNGDRCSFKLDTGSDVNVLPVRMYKQLKEKPEVKEYNESVKSYSNHNLIIEGTCNLKCKTKQGKFGIYEFIIINTPNKGIIGREMCENLELIKRVQTILKINTAEELIEEYQDVFKGLGELPGKYHITLDPNIQPSITPARRIPLTLHTKVKQTLKEMEEQEIIEKIEKPTDWVHPMLIKQEKGNKIRICLDPRLMNKGVKRQQQQIPTLETLTSEIKDATIFTVLDAAKAFYQIRLDEQSSELCTFSTPIGRYKFKRLPFGLNSAPEVFQTKINKILEGIEGVTCYFDDILIYAKSQREHDITLQQVLKRARDNKLKFDKRKMQLSKTSVIYMGQEIREGGIRITLERTKAINELKSPKNRQELKRFLGMIGYLTKFIKGLSMKTVYLRELLKTEVIWQWDQQAEADFKHLKDLIVKAPTLIHFDPKQESTITADASRDGMGAALIQDKGPIAYALSTFTDTQKNYSMIEKELMAILYGCEKFHYYVYGTSFKVETDHKPLVNLVKKPLQNLSPRLQKMVVKLLRYDATIVYVPGKTQYISDALSRDSMEETQELVDLEGEGLTVHLLLTASEARLQALRSTTQEDQEMRELTQYVVFGWPKRLTEVKQNIKKYWTYRDEIHISEGLVYRGDKIIIPKNDRHLILTKIHQTHDGVVACKNRARQGVYWPNISKDIEEFVKNCKICAAKSNAGRKEPILPHPIPPRPWSKIGIDFLEPHGRKDYIIAVDYFSKFVMIEKLTGKTAGIVIQFIKRIIATHGIPNRIMSDNGPPFDSREYIEFLEANDIEKESSSPMYPQSNGMVERTIETIKKRLEKTMEDGGDHYTVQLNYNSTTHNGLESPSEILMGRRLRTNIPVSDINLEPKYDIQNTRDQLELNKQKMISQGSEKSQNLTLLNRGQRVYYKHSANNWKPAMVIETDAGPRSYRMITEEGKYFRRNRKHIKGLGGYEAAESEKQENTDYNKTEEKECMRQKVGIEVTVEQNNQEKEVESKERMRETEEKVKETRSEQVETEVNGREDGRPKRLTCRPKWFKDYEVKLK